MNVNRVILAGRLTKDVEIRYTPAGTAVANVTLAINSRYKDNNGEAKEVVTFVRVVVWNKSAEVLNQYAKKGTLLLVEGRLQNKSWEDNNGNKRNIMEVRANSVQFVGNGQKNGKSENKNDEPLPEELM